MINVNVKASTEQDMNRDFEVIPEGIYNVKLLNFDGWKEGIDRKKNPYHRTGIKLEITDGPYKGRFIFDSLFVNEKTPEWVLGNFLASFTDSETEMNASEFKELEGNLGRVSTENNEGVKKKVDPNTGMEKSEKTVYTNVKNFLLKEKVDSPWPKA